PQPWPQAAVYARHGHGAGRQPATGGNSSNVLRRRSGSCCRPATGSLSGVGAGWAATNSVIATTGPMSSQVPTTLPTSQPHPPPPVTSPGLSMSGHVRGEVAAGGVVDGDGFCWAGVGGVEDDVVGVDVLADGSGFAVVEAEVVGCGGGADAGAEAGGPVDG